MSAPVIPIRNIYYLFCYAWDRFEEAKAISTEAEDSPDLPNLLARVLATGLRSLLRRGLDRNYLDHEEVMGTVRGHIELSPTLRLAARNARRIDCTFDELSHDLLHNQLIKATLRRLIKLNTLEPSLAHELHLLRLRMPGVSDISLTSQAFARVRLHRNNARYDLLLKICALAFENTIPLHGEGKYAFNDILRDERKMAMVFESFVRGFYRATQRAFRVRPLQLEWQATLLTTNGHGRLPIMRTDVYLESQLRRIIIDTKYYGEALQERFGTKSFRSDNLYQLFAYLRNDAVSNPEAVAAEGILLYPQVNVEISASYIVHGHTIRFFTIDLSQPWPRVERRLCDAISVDEESKSAVV